MRTPPIAHSLGVPFVLFCAVACAPVALFTSPTPTVTADMPLPTPGATLTFTTPTRAPITNTIAVSLTVWTLDDFAPNASPAGAFLQTQLNAFRAANPNLSIHIIIKKPNGKGGLLDFLQTTSAVVPSQLPDLILLDLADVPLAAELGILQPLDDWVPADLSNDLFPFAVRAARVRDQWLAVPFLVDVQHLAYKIDAVKKPPATWSEFLNQKAGLLAPLGGDDAYLLQYAAIAPVSPAPTFDLNGTTQVLDFFRRAHDAGLMNDAALGLKTVDEVWALFAAGQAPMAQVSAARWLSEREKMPGTHFAALPTRDGKSASVASGWAFAVVTNHPARQAASVKLVQWLMTPAKLTAWARASYRLPALRSAVSPTIDSVEYSIFLRDQLEHAVYPPRSAAYQKSAEAWRTAISNVWKGQATPAEAARLVVNQ